MLSQIKTLSYQTLIYGAGHVLTRLVTFLLIPLYTNVFTPAEYGVISLAYTFMGFIVIILHYGLDAALMKYYVPGNRKERQTYLASTYLSYVTTTAIFSGCLYLVRYWVADLILGGDYPDYLAIVAMILFMDVLVSVPLLLLRSEEKPIAFIAFSMINVVLSLGMNLLLVLKYEMGIKGVLYSNLITSATLIMLTAPLLLKRLRFRQASYGTWKKLMHFGLPFFPSGIFAMLMELADRYILKALTDMKTVGLYSAGYKLGMLMLLIVMGFNMGWQPFFLKKGNEEEKKKLFSRIATYVLVVLGFFWVVVLLWTNTIVRLKIGATPIYGAEFWPSTNIVPWIALGYLFHACYLLQLPGAFLKNKPSWIPVTRAIGAFSNIALNFLLIPIYGALGAAFATCLSFFFMATFMFAVNNRIYPIRFEWGRLVRIVLMIVGIYMLTNFINESNTRNMLLTFAYPFGLWVSGFLYPEEISGLRNLKLYSTSK